MFILYANKNSLTVHEREVVTSGAVNVHRVRFEFSREWEGLNRVAVFKSGPSGAQTVPILLDGSGECVVPCEVTDPDDAGKRLYAGVCGSRDGAVVLPTVWADLGVIQPGAAPGWASGMTTPGLLDQLLARLDEKQDRLTGRPGQVVGFDGSGRPAAQDLTGGPGGLAIAGDEDVKQVLDEVFGPAGK